MTRHQCLFSAVPVSFRWHTVEIRRVLVIKSGNGSTGKRFRVHVMTGFWDLRNDDDNNNNKNNNTLVTKSNYSEHRAVTRIAEVGSMFFIRLFFVCVEIALPKDLPLKKKKKNITSISTDYETTTIVRKGDDFRREKITLYHCIRVF